LFLEGLPNEVFKGIVDSNFNP